jgi:hypothetical protein
MSKLQFEQNYKLNNIIKNYKTLKSPQNYEKHETIL